MDYTCKEGDVLIEHKNSDPVEMSEVGAVAAINIELEKLKNTGAADIGAVVTDSGEIAVTLAADGSSGDHANASVGVAVDGRDKPQAGSHSGIHGRLDSGALKVNMEAVFKETFEEEEEEDDDGDIDNLADRLGELMKTYEMYASDHTADTTVEEVFLLREIATLQAKIINFQHLLPLSPGTYTDAIDKASSVKPSSPKALARKLSSEIYDTLDAIATSPPVISDKDDSDRVVDVKSSSSLFPPAPSSDDDGDDDDTVAVSSDKEVDIELVNPAQRRNYNIAKALHLLGDVRLLPPKASKVLGLYMSEEEERKLYRMGSKDNLVETLKVLSLPEDGASPKAIRLLGEPMLETRRTSGNRRASSHRVRTLTTIQNFDEDGNPMVEEDVGCFTVKRRFSETTVPVMVPSKAHWMMGGLDGGNDVRLKALKEKEEIPFDLERMKRYTLPPTAEQIKKRKQKVLQITGEVMLAGTKANKILGDAMTPEQMKQMKVNESRIAPVDEAQIMVRKMKFTAPDPGKINRKATALLGEKMLACEKAKRVLGNDSELEDLIARKKAASDKDPEFDIKRKRVFSAPEAGTVNAKAMQIMGESLLAATKAQKLLGSSDGDELARRLASKEKDPEIDIKMQKHFSAPDPSKLNAKALKVMGEKMLAAHKAQKVLGSDENDEDARKKAEMAPEPEVDINRMKRYTLPETMRDGHSHQNKKKLVELLGEAYLAGSKAEKLLGSPMSKKQMEDMNRANVEEAAERLRNPTIPADVVDAMKELQKMEHDQERRLQPRTGSPDRSPPHSLSPVMKRRSAVHMGIRQGHIGSLGSLL